MSSFARLSPLRCYIIAEIGGNFTTWAEARKLIDEAANCGVDAIKLQTYRAATLATRDALFDMENTGVTSQYELFRRFEIDESLHRQVFEYAEFKGLDWFSTPSHQTDVDMLERLGVGAYKIGSDDAVNLPFLRHIASLGKPVILSTGMCTLNEVRDSVAAMQLQSSCPIMLMHAVTSYPTHPEHVNLAAMRTLMQAFPNLPIGYSDHTVTPVAALAAAAMGARLVERHFTWDKTAQGPDHQLSSDPAEMRWLVSSIREFERMRGSGIKEPAACETVTRRNNRKSVVLARAVPKGRRLEAADLTVKRPGTGIEPRHLEAVIGRQPRRALKEDEVLTWELLQ